MLIYITPYVCKFVIDKPDVYYDFHPDIFLTGSFPYVLGLLGIVIHAIRLLGWKNFNKFMKGLSIFTFYELILSRIHFFVQELKISQIRTPEVETLSYYYNMKPFSFLRFENIVINIIVQEFGYGSWTQIVRGIPLMLPFIIVLYSYLKINPIKTNREIQISRFTWILFCVINISGRIISFIPFIKFGYQGAARHIPWLRFFQIISLISAILIMFLLIIYPETVLITEFQLHEAKDLYKYVSDKSDKPKGIAAFTDYKSRISNYISTLSPNDKQNLGFIQSDKGDN